jgi:hypothetical protein
MNVNNEERRGENMSRPILWLFQDLPGECEEKKKYLIQTKKELRGL